MTLVVTLFFLLQRIFQSEGLFSVSVLAHTLKSWLQKTTMPILIAKETRHFIKHVISHYWMLGKLSQCDPALHSHWFDENIFYWNIKYEILIFYYYLNIQKVFQKAFLLLTQFTPFNINVVTWPDLTWKCDNPSSMYIYICKYAHSQKYSLHRGSANCKWHKTSLGVLLTKQGLCETIPDQQL